MSEMFPVSDKVTPPASDRRTFLKKSSLAVAGSTLLGSLAVGRSAHAAGSDVLRIGLVGCGGRGTGAAAQALNADPNTKLVAVGDAFADRITPSLQNLLSDPKLAPKIDVPAERQFSGFDNYKQVIDSGVDVVLLAGPPGFRPLHFQYAVEKGKHIFAEKPVAVDAPGIRSIMASAVEARKKGLSVVSGLCYRYHEPKREIIKRIHNGEIGDIVSLHVSYNTGILWYRGENPAWTPMEYQMRNWLYYPWLSGDFNVEQHIHSLDKAAWVMKDQPPAKATGIGGRQVRTDEKWGNVYDHMSVVYEYDKGVKLFANCRQIAGCSSEVTDYVYGTQGTAELMQAKITPRGEGKAWRYRGEAANMYDQEHLELFAGIRSGNLIDNSDYMCKSTMLAIMGRMACYTGKTLTWDECLNSTESLGPAKYEWGPMPVPPVALPGITPFA